MSGETFYFLKLILEGLSKGQSATVESHEKEINVEEAAKIFFHLAHVMSKNYWRKEKLPIGRKVVKN